MRRIALQTAAIVAVLSLAACGSLFNKGDKKDKETPTGKRISVLTLEEKLEPDPRLSDVHVDLPRGYTNLAWPQPGGSPTNALHHLDLPKELTRVWSSHVGEGSDSKGRLTAVPVVADGKVFVLDTRATVGAFDEKTGKRLWQADLTPEGEPSYVGFGGGVAYADQRTFVSTGFGRVHALDAATGKEVWTRAIGVPIRTAPTAFHGVVYVVTTDNQIHAMAADTGLVIWSQRAIAESAGVLAATSPAVDGELVVAPFSSGELIAFRAENGNQIWSDTLSRTARFTALSGINDIAGRPVIDRDRVFAVSHSGRLVSIDIRTGERVWTQNVRSVQTPWVAGDFLYMVTLDAELVCLSRRDGRVRWITKMKRFRDSKDKEDPIQWAGPVLAGERLYVLSSRGQAVAYSPFTGEEVERFKLRDDAYLPPIVVNQTLFVLTEDGTLTAYGGKAEDSKAKDAKTENAEAEGG